MHLSPFIFLTLFISIFTICKSFSPSYFLLFPLSFNLFPFFSFFLTNVHVQYMPHCSSKSKRLSAVEGNGVSHSVKFPGCRLIFLYHRGLTSSGRVISMTYFHRVEFQCRVTSADFFSNRPLVLPGCQTLGQMFCWVNKRRISSLQNLESLLTD
jgi:hypothetical protein